MTKEKGQTLIEFIIVSLTLIPFMTMVLSLSYIIYSDQITSYVHYRALHCLEELDKNKETCEKKARQKIRELLYFHSYLKTSISKSRHKNQVTTSGIFFSYRFKYSKSLRLGLR